MLGRRQPKKTLSNLNEKRISMKKILKSVLTTTSTPMKLKHQGLKDRDIPHRKHLVQLYVC